MKHDQSQVEMLKLGKHESVSKRLIARSYNGPDLGAMLCTKLFKPDTPPASPPSFRANTMKTRLRLLACPFDAMKPEALAELDKLAGEGASIYDMINVIDVDYEMLHALPWDYKWFDNLFNRLERRAAHVRSTMGND